jgi:hypothetical protein
MYGVLGDREMVLCVKLLCVELRIWRLIRDTVLGEQEAASRTALGSNMISM